MPKIKILTNSGWRDFSGVRRTTNATVKILHTKGELISTVDHRFIIDGKEVLAKSLNPGDKLSTSISVVSVKLNEVSFVYDPVNVDGNHTYIHDGDIESHNCAFLGSSMTLLSGSTLARLSYDTPLKEFTDQQKGLKIYKYPELNHKYTISVDVSRGRHLDNSAFSVMDITDFPHTIAATYKNSEIAPLLYTSLVHNIATNYNKAYALIEINDVGAQIADTLWNELEYEGMFWTKSGDMLGKQGADPYPGVRTTKKTKRIGCANLKDMIDNNQLLINDYDTIQELSTFIQKPNGGYEADEGFHDDLVASLWLHAWMVAQPWFKELTDSDLRLKMHEAHIKSMEDDLLMPSFSDGNEQFDIRHDPAETAGWATVF